MKIEPPDSGPLRLAMERLVDAFHPAAVVLFGSQASGHASAASDYDFAILRPDAPVDFERLASVRSDLESDLLHDVDLVILDGASPVVAMQVLREGRLLDCRDREQLEEFTVRALSSYADLKTTRAPIERRLLEIRGR